MMPHQPVLHCESGLQLRRGPGDVEVFPDAIDVIAGSSNPYRVLVLIGAVAQLAVLWPVT